ncbi:GntR family transcriptional regulator [Clostridium ganghwense]|uniref:GntR family transcriptional regulator n=1 Tax=Clostridium ganghwense TaxID=312089 RepID=A0ABT4CM51_9CLOT|nr:GntR family transcriptional regulator [Clostridium ganghwense]MCY6370134.1 GntR family transcriptional regulator [Clostridium ganghwense]
MINIDSRSSKPIYEQVVDGIKENIIKGILQPGDKLPSVRELSAILTTNPNTISKAYKELERQKAIETIRGKGTYVASNYEAKIDKDKLEVLKKQMKNIVIEAHYMGMEKDKVINLLEEVYKELRE